MEMTASHQKPDVVVFSNEDPADPKNWSRWKKRIVTAQICTLAFAAVFGSSFYATAELQIRAKYGVNADTSSSGLTVYVLGFSLGPLLWGPMSEMYGRRIPYVVAWILLIAMCAPVAWVNNLPVIIIFRFLSGCCAACPLNNGGGILSDMYNIVDMQAQAIAIAWYAAAIFSGPCLALPVGFFIVVYAGPELWVLRVFFFFVIALLPVVLLLPETHGPTILASRSKKFRQEGRPNARAAHELKHETKRQLFSSHIGRPTSMFLREPIIQGAAIWTSLAYGIVYLFFEIYPIVFFEQHNFPLQLTGLPFIAMSIGVFIAAAFYVSLVRFFVRLPVPSFIQPKGQSPESPEARLKLALFACILMPISLFWFAWTSGGETTWVAPTLAGIPFGFATITIFFTFLTYTSQTYTIYASSSAACNTFFRSLAGSIFPVVSHRLVSSLGTKWGVSLFGFLSLGLIPIPLIFIRYGALLREKSHYAQEAAAIVTRMRAAAAAAKAQQAKVAQTQVAPPPPAAPPTTRMSDEDIEMAESDMETARLYSSNTPVPLSPNSEFDETAGKSDRSSGVSQKST